MAITIYNTLTKKKEEFVPIEPGKVKFYLCGPTVYDYFHIGNARPFILFEVYRRFLEYRGYNVTFVVNITDVDDKIIQRAREEGRSTTEVAKEFTRIYFEDLAGLKVRQADIHPKATDHIEDMIQMIQRLLNQGMAYAVDGDVFYHVESFSEYGKLSGKNIQELQAGSRVEVDSRKKNPLDFTLWKSAKPDEPSWDSPWGKGRPGWHIECSTMSMKYLGNDFDIHAGGVDLVFPHHENEIAQSCGIGDAHFAKYWMHNGFLNIQGEKMSKSLGNFLTAREILKRHRAEVIRLFFLQKHYRSPINYSEEIMEETRQAWLRLQNLFDELRDFEAVLAEEFDPGSLNDESKQYYEKISGLKADIIAAMDDDFNSAQAIGKLFEIVKACNRLVSKDKINSDDKKVLGFTKGILIEFDEFLGLISHDREAEGQKAQDVEKLMNILLEVRQKLREEKAWELADHIRDQLKEAGYVIEDKPEGSSWKKFK